MAVSTSYLVVIVADGKNNIERAWDRLVWSKVETAEFTAQAVAYVEARTKKEADDKVALVLKALSDAEAAGHLAATAVSDKLKDRVAVALAQVPQGDLDAMASAAATAVQEVKAEAEAARKTAINKFKDDADKAAAAAEPQLDNLVLEVAQEEKAEHDKAVPKATNPRQNKSGKTRAAREEKPTGETRHSSDEDEDMGADEHPKPARRKRKAPAAAAKAAGERKPCNKQPRRKEEEEGESEEAEEEVLKESDDEELEEELDDAINDAALAAIEQEEQEEAAVEALGGAAAAAAPAAADRRKPTLVKSVVLADEVSVDYAFQKYKDNVTIYGWTASRSTKSFEKVETLLESIIDSLGFDGNSERQAAWETLVSEMRRRRDAAMGPAASMGPFSELKLVIA